MKLALQLFILMIYTILAVTRDEPDLFGPKEENYTLGITAKVMTEDGKPLEGARVHVAIANFNDFIDHSNDIFGKSDGQGLFTTEGRGHPDADIRATMKGYYGKIILSRHLDENANPFHSYIFLFLVTTRW